ncbi:MAG: DUF4258 domain-containing protein [Acidobacteria bacterium]|nr:DUF4258 domain-containing protein [Acidobacteriota bacterium]
MKSIQSIRQDFISGDVEFTRHALRRVVERNISLDQILQASSNAEIIEDYPDDKYAPSCLLLGFTADGRPLHLQITRDEETVTRIITIYEPDPAQWFSYRVRR